MDIYKNATEIFEKYAHETRRESISIKSFSEQLLFYVAYSQESLIELLKRPLVSIENITKDTKIRDIKFFCNNNSEYSNYSKERINNSFIPYIRDIALQLYDLNIDINSIDCGFSKLLEDDIVHGDKYSVNNLLYTQKRGTIHFSYRYLSGNNQKRLYEIEHNYEVPYAGKGNKDVERYYRNKFTENTINFPITMGNTLGEIIDILQEKISRLEPQALKHGYKNVDIVFSENHPYPKIYYGHRRINYDYRYNILFDSIEHKERFYKGIETKEGQEIANNYINRYKRSLDQDNLRNKLIGNHADLLFINILATTNKDNTIDWNKRKDFMTYIKTIDVYKDYQRIRSEEGEYIVDFIRSREIDDERNNIYETINSYFYPLKQLDNHIQTKEYIDFEDMK